MAENFPLSLDALREVLDHLNLGVYITDLDRRIVLWNRKAQEITGHRAADVVGTACHDNILVHEDKEGHPLCSTDLCPLYRAMTLNRESDEPVLIFARRADGERLAVSVSVAPLRDDAGNVIGGIETFRDETLRILDLELARKAQRRLLPKSLPQDPRVRFEARYYPCDLVGGDFYDVRALGPGRYGVLVADVSGHGVSAALYSSWFKGWCNGAGELANAPAQFVSAMSHELRRVTTEETYATAFYAVVDADRGEVTYCNAGHPPPLHVRGAGGAVAELGGTGVPMGLLEGEAYTAATAALEPGDLILCYTDGVTEVTGGGGEILGGTGLAALLKDELPRTDGSLLDRLYRHVLNLCGEVSLADDILLLSIAGTPAAAQFNI